MGSPCNIFMQASYLVVSTPVPNHLPSLPGHLPMKIPFYLLVFPSSSVSFVFCYLSLKLIPSHGPLSSPWPFPTLVSI